MDASILLQLFKELGFPVGMVIVLIWWVFHMDKLNRADTNKQTERLDKNIEDLKVENKEDKKMFQSAINSFNDSVKEFKNVNREMTFVQTELKDIKTDLTIIKEKVK